MLANKPRHFRSGWHGYVVFTVAFGGVAAVTGRRALSDSTFWGPTAIFLGVLIFVYVWLGSFLIRIEERHLVLRSLTGGRIRVPLDAVRKVWLDVNLQNAGGPLRLFIRTDRDDIGTVSINAKVFRPDAIEAVLALGHGVDGRHDADPLQEGIVAGLLDRDRPRKKRRATRDK